MIPRHLFISVSLLLAVALATSVYVWHASKKARHLSPPAEYSAPVPAPAAGPTEKVTLYVAYDDPGVLLPQLAELPLPGGRQQHAEELLRAVVNIYLDQSSPHMVGPGSEVRNVYLIDPGTAVIDLNAAFADGHPSGILTEDLTVASLIQTLAVNVQGITRVKILVDGKERQTLAGHADLSHAYDPASISQLVQQLSPGK